MSEKRPPYENDLQRIPVQHVEMTLATPAYIGVADLVAQLLQEVRRTNELLASQAAPIVVIASNEADITELVMELGRLKERRSAPVHEAVSDEAHL